MSKVTQVKTYDKINSSQTNMSILIRVKTDTRQVKFSLEEEPFRRSVIFRRASFEPLLLISDFDLPLMPNTTLNSASKIRHVVKLTRDIKYKQRQKQRQKRHITRHFR